MRIRIAAALGLLVVGVGLLVAGIVLGLVGAERYRAFLAFGIHAGDPCVAAPGHAGPGDAGPLAQIAIWLSALGLIPAAGTLLVDRRPLPMLCAITLAGSCVIAIWLDWSVVHGIATCAPWLHYRLYGDSPW